MFYLFYLNRWSNHHLKADKYFCTKRASSCSYCSFTGMYLCFIGLFVTNYMMKLLSSSAALRWKENDGLEW